MITLGLDPSLTGFGWCVHRSDLAGSGRVLAKGVWNTPAKQIFIQRYMVLRESVKRLLELHPSVEGVGVESPPFGELWSEGLYGLFLYVVEAIFTHRLDVVFFDPSTVKLLAKMDPGVRRGTMDKRDMISAARADTGIARWNHNEADAYLIARSAARFWDLYHKRLSMDELTPAEQRSFARVCTCRGSTVEKGLLFREDDRFFRFSLLDPGDTVGPEVTNDSPNQED